MALVLTREPEQSIIIGDPLAPMGYIKVIEVRSNGSVRLAIDLPEGIPIHRSEVAEQIRREALPGIVEETKNRPSA